MHYRNLVPTVSHLISLLTLGGSKMRNPRNEIGITGVIRRGGGGGVGGTWHSFLTNIMFFALNSSSVELHLD